MGRTSIREAIAEECDKLKELLLRKNESYGNSALEPVRIFSSASSIEQLNVRIDDKLARLMRGGVMVGEDTIQDLTGYLILLMVARRTDVG